MEIGAVEGFELSNVSVEAQRATQLKRYMSCGRCQQENGDGGCRAVGSGWLF